MKFADIIVDISHEKLDKTFQYIVPASMEDTLAPGMLVLAPFGMGNRLIKGYVIQITETPVYPIEKMKEIDSLVSGSLPIESKLIELAAWIRENYGGTMNQALKTVIPVKMKTKPIEETYLKLIASPEKAKMELFEAERKKSTKARARLLREMIAEGEISQKLIIEKLNISRNTIDRLCDMGIIEKITYDRLRTPVKSGVTDYNIVLNESQKKVADAIKESMEKKEGRTHLICGVTGSGKTEVYIDIIDKNIKDGKEAIVMIPEIALTYQTVMRFQKKFGDQVSIINSKLSPGEKHDQFERAKKGDIKIIVGPRSALFTPFKNLGLIIIDEEHEGAYKSEGVPKYHARETAIKRAEMDGATVVLGSATPSVDSYYNALKGKYVLHNLPNRAGKGNMANVSIVDLREELKQGNKSIFSRKLQSMIRERLDKKEQTMLFINRRGYAGFVSCRSCGEAIKCPHCDVSLTLHNNGYLVCHYCGYEIPMPKTCPKCESKFIAPFGTGTEKVEGMIKAMFPEARVLRMDMDTTRLKDGHEKILSKFANQEADILVGTQMIVKGHDFPMVTLVGVLAADLSLYSSDFRASERTFELLTQAAGRAGRGRRKGDVVIQTYAPDNYSIELAAKQDYEAFYEEEISYRMLLKYPPCFEMAAILLTSSDADKLNKAAECIKDIIVKHNDNKIDIIGPADANIKKINDIYRKVFYLKHKDICALTKMKDDIEKETNIAGECGTTGQWMDVNIQFDFKPMGNY